MTINENDVTNPISDGKINIKFKVNQNPLVCVSQGDTENKQVIYKKTSEIVLKFNTNKDIKPICSYARIKYLNADYFKQNSIFLKKPTPSNFIDAFYFPFKIFNTEQITNDSLSNVIIKTYDDEKFFVNPNYVNETLISNIGIAEDIDNVMFFSYVKMKNGKEIALNFTGNTVKQPTTITEYFENIFDNQRLIKNTIIGSDNKPKQILNFTEYNNEITKSDLNKYFSGILLKKSSFQRIKIALTSASSISQEMDVFLKINKVDELKDQWIKYSAALYIFDTSYNIVELTTTPPIFLYAKIKPDNDGLILVDEDISIIPLQSDGDELLTCKTPVITGGTETGSIQAFISALESVASTHPPSKKILDNVFKKIDNSGAQINNISVYGSTLTVVDREYLKSNYYWLAEACTVYTMWKYCQLLTEYVNVNGPTNDLVEYIKLKNTIPKSLKNTANRSYIDNGKLVEENFSSTLELNEFWISVLRHNKSQDERIIFLQFNINKDFKDPKTNKYIDTTNRISFTSVKSLPEGSTPTHERILSFLKRLNKTILQFINNEINCLYKYILNDNNVKFPETYVIGVGDGGGTEGVLGEDNVGVLFFNYDYYQPNIGGSILPLHYKIISKLKYPVIHFDLFGFDDNNNKRILIINKNDGNIDEYCLFIADKNIKQFVPHHFTNDRPFDISNSGFDINKEFPTNSLDFTTTGTESVFKNNKGKTLAKYNNSTNNIVFLDHKNNDTYNLILYDYLDSDGKGRNHLDEIHLVVNILPPFSDNSIIPGINNFNLSIKDLFESDSFKIKDPKKDNLDTELNKQSDAIAELALRISNIPNNQNHFNDLLNIQITPLFIGMEENRTNKIISNPKYYFNRDRNKREIESTDGANLKLRYSGLNVNYSDDNTINIFIESSVDPQRSRLDKFEHWSNISSNDFNNNLLPNLDSFTTFGANNFDPALNDNYIVVDNSKKPSYNALLCCFRSFALLKYVIDNYVKPAMTNNSERGSRQILLDNVLNNILIQVNTNIGLAKNVTGDDFSTFNTYAK